VYRRAERKNEGVRFRNFAAGVSICAVVLSGCASEVPPGEFVGEGAAAGAAPVQNGGPTTGPGGSVDGGAVAAPSLSSAPTGGSGGGGGAVPGTTQGPNPQASPVGATTNFQPGSCAGFRNGTGITNSQIILGNAADRTGPVPGIFTAAQQAVMAYAAYFNTTSTICGRKLKVIPYDSQTSSTGDQQAAASACDDTFAMIGSMGAFDNGGAQTVTHCGIPDLRAITTTPERHSSPVSFGTESVDTHLVSTVQYRLLKAQTGNAYLKSAMLYLNAGAAVPNALSYKQAMERLGYKFLYTQPIDVAAFNYAPYAAQIKSLGVQFVQFEGAYQYAVRLKRALSDQGINPVFVMDSVAYDPIFSQAGDDLRGMYSYTDTSMFEEASRSAELRLYLSWLQRVSPGAKPTFFGIYAWGAMRLFAQLATQLGGALTRQNLLQAIRGVHDYTANGLFAPQNIGSKRSPNCETLIQLTSSGWQRRSPYPYSCSDLIATR